MTIDPDSSGGASGRRRRQSGGPPDHRGSPIPTWGMIATRFMELRKRRGLMIALVVVTIGIPTVFLADPAAAARLGAQDLRTGRRLRHLHRAWSPACCTSSASSSPPPWAARPARSDLTEGMFRHLVVTGRSRWRSIWPGSRPDWRSSCLWWRSGSPSFAQCACSPRQPSSNYDGVNVPAGLSRSGSRPGPPTMPTRSSVTSPSGSGLPLPSAPPSTRPLRKRARGQHQHQAGPWVAGPTAAHTSTDQDRGQLDRPHGLCRLLAHVPLPFELADDQERALARARGRHRVPGRAGARIADRAADGRRNLMIVLEVVLTPIFSRARIAHLSNLQRAVVGLATAHLAPGGLPVFGGGAAGQGAAAEEIPGCCLSPPRWPSA